MVLVLSLLNALAVALNGVFGGLAARRMALRSVFLVASLGAVAVAVSMAATTPASTSLVGMGIGLLAGIIGGIGVPLSYRALAIGPVGVAATIITCVITGVLATVAFLSGEDVTLARVIALLLAAGAIALVAQLGRGARRVTSAAIGLSVMAGVLFGLFAVIIRSAPVADEWWPLVAARLGVLLVALIFFRAPSAARATSMKQGWSRRGALLASAAGVLDVSANVFLVLALREGDLILIAIVTSIAPIFTAVIGRLFLREHLTRGQTAGVVLAVVAVAISSIGAV